MTMVQRQRSPSPNVRHLGINLPLAGVPQKVKKFHANDTSHSERTVTLYIDGADEYVAIGAQTSTTVQEVIDVMAYTMKVEPQKIQIKRRLALGSRIQTPDEEVASFAIVCGLSSSKRAIKQFDYPIVIIGGGLGGIQTMVDMERRGRSDFMCIEKHADFGGHSWISVANRFTKLQTEKGTYHVDYILTENPVPTTFEDIMYKTWPNKPALLKMFRESARAHGLYEKTLFNTCVEKVADKKDKGFYAVYHVPVSGDGDATLVQAGAVVAWPGNLCELNKLTFKGEEDFGGYIEYSSFDVLDYPKCEGKVCILYGHGAFTIENVRTLVEHRVKKVIVICRRRNICGMKMASWMVSGSEIPVPGNVMLDIFQKMYDLVGWDVWTAHCVQTDANRTFAHISQKTVFGVTDVYFLAGYFGLMEVVVDEIESLSHLKCHTKKGLTFDCDVVIKAIGTSPSFEIDRQLGLKELVGVWANGDPLRPVNCNGMFVQARNFGSFSSGPAFATVVKVVNWFIDFPEDFLIVEKQMPRQKAGERPAYVPSGTYLTPMFMALSSMLPGLASDLNDMDVMKSRKQRLAHPLKEYLQECRDEWQGYIKQFRDAGIVDDRPDPPYPYTQEIMEDFIRKADVQAYTAQAKQMEKMQQVQNRK